MDGIMSKLLLDKMLSFDELLEDVKYIDNVILSNVIFDDQEDDPVEFQKHLLSSKSWFTSISWVNKKRFLISLIKGTKSIWTISLILKSIWNSRTKDAIMSLSERNIFSSYDQVPMDHNRTAQPLSTLKIVMHDEIKWFLSLEPERQAVFIANLLTVAGGPIIWEVHKVCQQIYEEYMKQQLEYLRGCIIVNDITSEKIKPLAYLVSYQPKKEQAQHRKISAYGPFNDKQGMQAELAQKELEAKLALWSSKMKSMRDSMKLEELEMISDEGAKRKLWKINRTKQETMETLDLIQLLPSAISKRILIYLPLIQLGDCARVNKYWAYLVDEIRMELAARLKINFELDKMRDNILRHDDGLNLFNGTELPTGTITMEKPNQPSTKVATKKYTTLNKNPKLKLIIELPIRNMIELHERLNRRGAADAHISRWCLNILKFYKEIKIEEIEKRVDFSVLEKTYFPSPAMVSSITLPLKPPLTKDPTIRLPMNPLVNVSSEFMNNISIGPTKKYNKHCRIWSKEYFQIHPATKIPSYYF